MNTVIQGGRLIDPANGIDAPRDLYLQQGKVLAVGEAPEGFVAEQTIDATGQVVCPGLVDLQAFLREPGQTQKGTIASESAAAAAGGVTTLCCPPQTQPVLDTPAVARLIQDRAAEAGLVRVLPLGALTKGLEGEQLANMMALKAAGCVGFSNVGAGVASAQTLLRCLEYAATHDLLVLVRPQEPSLSSGCAHDGAMAMRLGLEGIPAVAETLEVSRYLLLAEQAGARLHFGQLSCERSVKMIEEARERGQAVSCDLAVHQLLLDDGALEGFDGRFHLSPPLRSEAERAGLRAALVRGGISALCSDHQPHEASAKAAPFSVTEPGMIGLQTLLPLGLKLVEQDLLSLSEMIALLSSEPARILGLEQGQLGVGAPADICIFDPEQSWQLDELSNASIATNTPFWGQQLQGQVSHTLLAGERVYSR
ncbi:dihydroorotase [Motiliproteus sp.]|uniref:dihydroorotase n=1 Tax=Motiliproteus sp. TaxID=1898955 RepID=UPI003BA98543